MLSGEGHQVPFALTLLASAQAGEFRSVESRQQIGGISRLAAGDEIEIEPVTVPVAAGAGRAAGGRRGMAGVLRAGEAQSRRRR